jgi:glutaconate CoA-transferase, subunit A
VTGKLLGADEVAERITNGMTIGIGGWGSRRKPMALVRALVRSGVRDLTLVSFGGPDVGILCATGQVRKVVYGFVTLDSIPIEPNFARIRQAGAVEVVELDEAMLVAGLRAAGRRLPFEAIRSGLGSDVLATNPDIRLIPSPYSDGEVLVAMPAVPLDVALVHLNVADVRGNAMSLGPDPYFDDLFALAAEHTYISADQVVPTGELPTDRPLTINRTAVDGVVHSPGGAHFTSCLPNNERDEAFQREYASAAATEDGWNAFRARFLSGGEADYQREIAAFASANSDSTGAL